MVGHPPRRCCIAPGSGRPHVEPGGHVAHPQPFGLRGQRRQAPGDLQVFAGQAGTDRLGRRSLSGQLHEATLDAGHGLDLAPAGLRVVDEGDLAPHRSR